MVFMKTKLRSGRPLAFVLLLGMFTVSQNLFATETNSTPVRIGVYDSRAVAYAHFWSESHQRQLKEMVAEAKKARAAGNTNRFEELDAALKTEREQNHLQVFSTAPVDDLLAGMQDRISAIRKETRIEGLVSKWDKVTLGKHQRAEQIDVTELLLRDFKLTDKQRRVAEEIQTKPPVPLDKAQKLMREGKL